MDQGGAWNRDVVRNTEGVEQRSGMEQRAVVEQVMCGTEKVCNREKIWNREQRGLLAKRFWGKCFSQSVFADEAPLNITVIS